MTQRIPASLVALALLGADPALAQQGTPPAQGRGADPAQSAQPPQSQRAPEASPQQTQASGQGAQPQDQAGAANCQTELNAFARTMEEDGFWLDGYRQDRAATPAAAGALPAGTAIPPGTAPNMGQGAGGRSDTSMATAGQQANTAPAAQQQSAPRDPMARMDWRAAPMQSLRTLYAAAHVLAANGSDAACRTVLAEARQIYGTYTARLRQAGVDPAEIRSYRQSQLALAEPVTEMGHGLRVDEITGTDVRNPQDQRLGTVQDVILDPRSGRIAYAILGRGGFLGIGRDYVAVPWSQLRAAPGMRSFVLDVSEQRLGQAPQVERNAFASEADFARHRGEIDRFWSGRAG